MDSLSSCHSVVHSQKMQQQGIGNVFINYSIISKKWQCLEVCRNIDVVQSVKDAQEKATPPFTRKTEPRKHT
ncbi:hypothetical protein P8452_03289 [Trifolium repens]|nr:hypothetical protein P8452_03289 [Trifolium repens]